MDVMAATLQQQKAIVEQLRREAAIKRIPVSEACNLLLQYIAENQEDDCLLNGFTSQKVNPFREKSNCNIL